MVQARTDIAVQVQYGLGIQVRGARPSVVDYTPQLARADHGNSLVHCFTDSTAP